MNEPDRAHISLDSAPVMYWPLGVVANIVTERSAESSLDRTTYVGVDNLLSDFGGRKDSEHSTSASGAIRFVPGDILIGNIRPYLKKVWLADREGGASPDVVTLSIAPEWRTRILPRFLYFALTTSSFVSYSVEHSKGAKMPRGDKAALMRFRIPIPSVQIQRKIVQILDDFTTFEAELRLELQAELEARRRQYDHYRDQLLGGRSPHDSWRPLGELGEFTRGRRFTRADIVDAGIPSVHYGEIYTHFGVSASAPIRHVSEELRPHLRFAIPGDVIIASVGETVEDVGKAVAWLGEGPIAIHDDTFGFRHSMDPKFVSYWLQTEAFHAQKTRHVASAKVKRLSSTALASILMPVPAIEEQRRVVNILDNFDALYRDLSIELPAELSARRKQYEYYRDELLTFEDAPA